MGAANLTTRRRLQRNSFVYCRAHLVSAGPLVASFHLRPLRRGHLSDSCWLYACCVWYFTARAAAARNARNAAFGAIGGGCAYLTHNLGGGAGWRAHGCDERVNAGNTPAVFADASARLALWSATERWPRAPSPVEQHWQQRRMRRSRTHCGPAIVSQVPAMA